MVNFFSHQPALNYGFYKPEKPWQQPVDAEGPRATVKELMNIMSFWLSLGCDGFRVDMAGSLVKNDEDGKGTIQLWKEIRDFLNDKFPEAAMVSEWGEPDKSLQGGFHMDFLLHFGPSHYNDLFRCENPFFAGNGDASAFVKKYIENYEKSERKGLICIPSGNHDMIRLAKTVHGDKAKIAFAFLLSMPGAPFIYYGDEIGMRYVEGLTSVEGGYERTGSRSPMQWSDSVNAGFSSAASDMLYIRQDESDDRPTVQKSMEEKDSLWNEVHRLITIRQEHSALQSLADIRFVYAEENKYPLAYVRENAEEKILVYINPSDKEVSFTFEEGKNGESIYAFGQPAVLKDGTVTAAANSAGFVRI